MPSRDQFLKLASECAAARDRHLALAAELHEQEKTLLELAERAGKAGIPGDMELNEALHKSKRSDTVNVNMTDGHRLAISRGMRKRHKNKDAAFVKAYRDAGFSSQNAFAEYLGISVASLSRYRNDRPCPPDVFEKVKRRTGFTAPWPGGVSSD